MRKPNSGFVRSLELIDPLLSVRFGEMMGQWVIERKAHLSHEEVVYLERRRHWLAQQLQIPSLEDYNEHLREYVGVSEEVISAQTGRRVILFAKKLDNRIFDALCLSDIQRYGGYSRYADELEMRESRQAAERSRQRSERFRSINAEAFDILNFIWDKRETKLLDGERDLNVLLHGKKRDKPPVELK